MKNLKTALLILAAALVLSCGGGGAGGSGPGVLYFTADTGSRTLWSYDILNGSVSSSLGMTISSQGLFLYDGKIHFQKDDYLWSYDTNSDMSTIVSFAYPRYERAAVYRDRLFFPYNDGVRGMELWSYEASSGITTLVADINTDTGAGSDPDFFTVYDDRLFFKAVRNDVGEELWYYNEPSDAVTLAADINVTGAGEDSGVSNLVVYDDRLFFSAYSVSGNRELWAYDSASNAATPGDRYQHGRRQQPL